MSAKTMAHAIAHPHHVAYLFRGRKMLATAYNLIGTRSRGYGYNKRSIHAEANVIRTFGDIHKLRGTTLVVIRISASGIMLSKPCKACQCIIQKCMTKYGLKSCIHS